MIYLIPIVSAILSVLLLFIQFLLIKFERYLESDFSSEFIKKTMDISEEVSIEYGKLYAYNPISRMIIIEKKDTYSICDYFKLNHEIAHSRDDRTRVIYFYMILIAIYRVFFIPICIIVCILELCGVTIGKEIFYLLITILASFILIKTYYVLIYETRASKAALYELKKSVTSKEANDILNFAVCCFLQQLFITFIMGASIYFFIDLSMK